MDWNYEYVNQKLFPAVRGVWTIKGVVEETAPLSDQVYLIDAVTGKHYTYAESNVLANRIAHSPSIILSTKRLVLFLLNK